MKTLLSLLSVMVLVLLTACVQLPENKDEAPLANDEVVVDEVVAELELPVVPETPVEPVVEEITTEEAATEEATTEEATTEEAATEEATTEEAATEEATTEEMATEEPAVEEVTAGGGTYVVYADEIYSVPSSKVLFFHAGWCPTCKTLDEELTARVSELPLGTMVLKVDYDTSDLKTKYAVTSQHTIVFVDGENNETSKLLGPDFDAIKGAL